MMQTSATIGRQLAWAERRPAIRQVADELTGGASPTVERWFDELQLPMPIARPVVRADDVQPERNRALWRYWSSLRCGQSLPRIDQIEPVDMRDLLGTVILSDIIDDGFDVRYRVFGSMLTQQTSVEMTGRRLSDLIPRLGTSPAGVMLTAAVNLRVVADRQPWYSEHAPPLHITTSGWKRLVLPLTDGTGRIVRLLQGVVPATRASMTHSGRSVLSRRVVVRGRARR